VEEVGAVDPGWWQRDDCHVSRVVVEFKHRQEATLPVGRSGNREGGLGRQPCVHAIRNAREDVRLARRVSYLVSNDIGAAVEHVPVGARRV